MIQSHVQLGCRAGALGATREGERGPAGCEHVAFLDFLTMHCREVFATELLCSLCQNAPEVLGGQ